MRLRLGKCPGTGDVSMGNSETMMPCWAMCSDSRLCSAGYTRSQPYAVISQWRIQFELVEHHGVLRYIYAAD